MISVILPIYNVQDYIYPCIKSILDQSFSDFELICVNDCSMDNSLTILKELQKQDCRIKIIHNHKNLGLGASRNIGLINASGEYIVFVDSDDLLMPSMLEDLICNIKKEKADLVFCDVLLYSEIHKNLTPYKPFHDISLAFKTNYNSKSASLFNLFSNYTNMWPSAWNKIYKKSIIDKFNIRFPEQTLYEDHFFYYSYLFHTTKVYYLSKPLYIYRTDRMDSIMNNVSPQIFDVFPVLDQLNFLFEQYFSKNDCQELISKLSVRLIWERTTNFDQLSKNSQICKSFYDTAFKYLSKFKKKHLLKYKDYFISDSEPFLYSRFMLLLRKIFSWNFIDYKDVIYIFGIRIQKSNYSFRSLKFIEYNTRLNSTNVLSEELLKKIYMYLNNSKYL